MPRDIEDPDDAFLVVFEGTDFRRVGSGSSERVDGVPSVGV